MVRDGFDEFGNPQGRAFDLGGGDEDRVRGEKILFYICPVPDGIYAESELRQLMAERGLHLDIRHAPRTGGCDLTEQILSGYSQLWYLSGQTPTLSSHQLQMIIDYVRRGHGLAIWADNEPFYADANLLAQALTGSRFVGNKIADQNMIPGPPGTNGQFIEHALTQGVNNLYEGITICTIEPAPGVTILGQSHDGQRCLGCFEREGQRIVLDTGFTKLYSVNFHRSAGLGRYLSNIAFWLARGSRGVDYKLLTPGRGELATIRKGETSQGYRFPVSDPARTTSILQWDGKATLGITLRAPDGTVARRETSSRSPLRVSLPTGAPGTWTCEVEGIDVLAPPQPYVLTISSESPGAPTSTPKPSGVSVPSTSTAGQSTSGAPASDATEPRVVLPFYVICDVSAAARSSINELNTCLRDIHQELMRDPRADDVVMLSIIAFDETASTVVSLAAPSAIRLPILRATGSRSIGAAVREFHRAFEQDRNRLKAHGARLFRPCVFLLVHGAPTDPDYHQTFRSLLGYDPATQIGNRAYPNVVAIGLPGAGQDVLTALAYPDFGDPGKRGRWFLAEPGASTVDLLPSVAAAIGQSVTDAYAATSRGAGMFVPPSSIPGMIGGVAGQDV